jgi:hypothetical protein
MPHENVQDKAVIAPARSLPCDPDETARFFDWLNINEPSVYFTTDDDKSRGDRSLTRVLYGPLTDRLAELEDLNGKGAGVFFCVCRTRGKSRKKKDIIGARAAFVDLDGAPIEPVLAWKPAPNIVVESSPGKFHAYWRLEGKVSPDKYLELLRRLAALFNGDPAVCDLTRVMRLPGFWHQKNPAQPFLTRVILDDCDASW